MKKYNLEIIQDECAQSPDQWDNDDAFIVYDHGQFNVERKGFTPYDIYEHLQSGKSTYNGYHVFTLYAYIHSGVALSIGRNQYPFTCKWDTSSTGFVLVKRRAGTYTREHARKVANSIVSEWNQYLSGDVWGIKVTDEHGEVLESIWGYYGREYAEQEGQTLLKNIERVSLKAHLNKLKEQIKAHVPFIYRTAWGY